MLFDTRPLQWMRQLDWQNAEWYINNRSLPDKAINLLDKAGSMVKLANDGLEDDLTLIQCTPWLEHISSVFGESKLISRPAHYDITVFQFY